MMYELALFAGAGGGLLASSLLGWQTIGYVESDKNAAAILQARIRGGYLHDAPIWSDIRSFTKRNNTTRRYIREMRSISSRLVVTGGFPCQPFSSAGKQLAADDPRNMWPATLRILSEIRPRYAYLENVPSILSGTHGYFGIILRGLAEIGYDARWGVLSAAYVGAPHIRKRLWIVAYPNSADSGMAVSNATRQRAGYAT